MIDKRHLIIGSLVLGAAAAGSLLVASQTYAHGLRPNHGMADRQARMEERLNQAVTDGKITADQKAAIIAKHEEMKTKMDAHREEMKAWAETNGLDPKFLGHHRHGKFRR